MANYLGDYQSDSGRFFYRVKLDVYLVESPKGGIRGTRLNTTFEEDKKYLPDFWYSQIKPLPPKFAGCPPPDGMRYLLIWLDNTRYLHIDCPFMPGTNPHFQLINDFAYKLKGQEFKTIAFQGEQLDSRRLKLHVKSS